MAASRGGDGCSVYAENDPNKRGNEYSRYNDGVKYIIKGTHHQQEEEFTSFIVTAVTSLVTGNA